MNMDEDTASPTNSTAPQTSNGSSSSNDHDMGVPACTASDDDVEYVCLALSNQDTLNAMFDAIKDFVQEVNIKFTKNGMEMLNTDSTEIVHVFIELPVANIARSGGSYVYNTGADCVEICLNVKLISTIFKTAISQGDIVEIRIYASELNCVHIIERNVNTRRSIASKVKVIKIDTHQSIDYVRAITYDSCISLESVELYDNIKKLCITESNVVRFWCNGEIVHLAAHGQFTTIKMNIHLDATHTCLPTTTCTGPNGQPDDDGHQVGTTVSNETPHDTIFVTDPLRCSSLDLRYSEIRRGSALLCASDKVTPLHMDEQFPLNFVMRIAKAKSVSKIASILLSDSYPVITFSYDTEIGSLRFILSPVERDPAVVFSEPEYTLDHISERIDTTCKDRCNAMKRKRTRRVWSRKDRSPTTSSASSSQPARASTDTWTPACTPLSGCAADGGDACVEAAAAAAASLPRSQTRRKRKTSSVGPGDASSSSGMYQCTLIPLVDDASCSSRDKRGPLQPTTKKRRYARRSKQTTTEVKQEQQQAHHTTHDPDGVLATELSSSGSVPVHTAPDDPTAQQSQALPPQQQQQQQQQKKRRGRRKKSEVEHDRILLQQKLVAMHKQQEELERLRMQKITLQSRGGGAASATVPSTSGDGGPNSMFHDSLVSDLLLLQEPLISLSRKEQNELKKMEKELKKQRKEDKRQRLLAMAHHPSPYTGTAAPPSIAHGMSDHDSSSCDDDTSRTHTTTDPAGPATMATTANDGQASVVSAQTSASVIADLITNTPIGLFRKTFDHVIQ